MILAGGYAAAILALCTLPLPLWAMAALLLLLLASFVFHVRRDALLSAPSSGTKFVLDEEGVVLTLRSGQQLTGRLLRSSLITPFLTVLNVLPQGTHMSRSVVILPDSLELEFFRQLRVWLKWS